jgi:hypothetical protein
MQCHYLYVHSDVREKLAVSISNFCLHDNAGLPAVDRLFINFGQDQSSLDMARHTQLSKCIGDVPFSHPLANAKLGSNLLVCLAQHDVAEYRVLARCE